MIHDGIEKVFSKKMFIAGLLAIMFVSAGTASAEMSFKRIVVFGTSLSDPGNAFALWGRQSDPPYDMLNPFLVPDWPYAIGGHHYTNGAGWTEQFGRGQGLAASVRPAFKGSDSKGTNYAVGRARARDDASTGNFVNLSAQVNAFMSDFNGAAPSDALYVIEIGSNDLQDALTAFAGGGDGGTVIRDAIVAIGNNIGALYGAGARKFLVWNIPDIGLTPAIRILDAVNPGARQVAGLLTGSFNANLDSLLSSMTGLPGIEIARFDAHSLLNTLVADPAAYGLTVTDAACVTPNLPPFQCETPEEFLFWDGIHPSRAVNGIIAQEAIFSLQQK